MSWADTAPAFRRRLRRLEDRAGRAPERIGLVELPLAVLASWHAGEPAAAAEVEARLAKLHAALVVPELLPAEAWRGAFG